MNAPRKNIRDRIHAAIESSLARRIPWAGIAYRVATIDYANRNDIIAGVGSRIHGGRWNPKDAFEAVYASLNPHAALAEALATYEDYGIPITKAMPLVLVALDVRLEIVVHLTEGDFWKRIRVSQHKVLQESWEELQEQGEEALSQTLGRVAFEAGAQGLVVPSTRFKDATNLVVFPGMLGERGVLRVQNIEKLPEPR